MGFGRIRGPTVESTKKVGDAVLSVQPPAPTGASSTLTEPFRAAPRMWPASCHASLGAPAVLVLTPLLLTQPALPRA